MKVIVDSKIPYIEGIIEKLVDEVAYIPGNEIKPQDVKDADAMFIRTRTRCDRQLLEGSKVKLIITATIGFDHIDTAYCREAGIVWENCPGCNAGAVEQYVHSSLSLLRQEKGINLRNACLGIVGVGHVGSRIAAMAQRIGMRVLLNDPPRADRGEQGFTDLTGEKQVSPICIRWPRCAISLLFIRRSPMKGYTGHIILPTTIFSIRLNANHILSTLHVERLFAHKLSLPHWNSTTFRELLSIHGNTNPTSTASYCTKLSSGLRTLPAIP